MVKGVHTMFHAAEAEELRFPAPISDAGFGWVTRFGMPGGVEVELYQPRYRKGGA